MQTRMRKPVKCATAALFCFLFYPASLPAQSQKTLLLGLASISGGIDILYVTKKIGAFKRNGLDVDFVLFQGGSQALSRSLFSHLIPTGREAQYFALYEISNRGTSLLGRGDPG